MSDSELSSDVYENDHNESEDHDSDSEGQENWDEIPAEELAIDVPTATPLPEPSRRKSRLQKVNALVMWLSYFLLFWQTSCKLSENGLVWLLQFLFQFMKVLGVTVSNEFLSEVIAIMPSSLYLPRRFVNLDRDYFTKYVVCPKCTKLYSYDSCLEATENNRTVAKRCSNTFTSRRQKKTCNAQLVGWFKRNNN